MAVRSDMLGARTCVQVVNRASRRAQCDRLILLVRFGQWKELDKSYSDDAHKRAKALCVRSAYHEKGG